MGGFVALELARHARAETVRTLLPGGFLLAGDGLLEIGTAAAPIESRTSKSSDMPERFGGCIEVVRCALN